MASVRKEFVIDARPEDVWAAVRDVGAVHTRLAPGFVVDARLEGEVRTVTFANGLVAREVIVDLDDAARRVAYASVGGRASHHHATMQVLAEGDGRARMVWVTDVLPHELARPIGALVEEGARAIKRALERSP